MGLAMKVLVFDNALGEDEAANLTRVHVEVTLSDVEVHLATFLSWSRRWFGSFGGIWVGLVVEG